jgi:hypothetical protein
MMHRWTDIPAIISAPGHAATPTGTGMSVLGHIVAVMLARLDDIDWDSMSHAYGPATEVPGLIRGLASDDPATRESALDAMYGGVHHQGDVYDCTLAVIPFLLEIAGVPGLPGRGPVLELLASIGGIEGGMAHDMPDRDGMYWATARRMVEDAREQLAPLLDDPDPEVRRAAPMVLLACRDDAASLLPAFLARASGEADEQARAALVRAACELARLGAAGRVADVDTAAVGGWLARQVADGDSPAVRRADALAELARCAPDLLPPDPVPMAARLLEAAYAAGTLQSPPDPRGFTTPTLVGAVRDLFEQEADGRRFPEGGDLVRKLSTALGDRVEERAALLGTLARSPHWEARHDALRVAGALMQGWRGDYEDLVAAIGGQLADSHPRITAAAADTLHHLDVLAAPAADALARHLAANPQPGPVLDALAALGDPRALPVLRRALEQPASASAGHLAGKYGPAAADLVPLIRERLRDLPAVTGHDSARAGLAVALGRIGLAAAAAVPDLLQMLPETAALVALGRIGTAASSAVPALEALLGDPAYRVQVGAAVALHRIGAGPGPLLPVLARHLNGDNHYAATSAAEALAELGPAAAPLAPRLRELAARNAGEDILGNWLRLRAAVALWRSAGESAVVVPALLEAWQLNPHTRIHVATCLAEMGEAASSTTAKGETTVALLHGELSRRRRHNSTDHTWSPSQVAGDLALIGACERALAALGE